MQSHAAGLAINPHRPDDRLPYRGAWLNIGPEMIHLMELPNPDDLHGRPEHGGRDRHFCIGIDAGGVEPLMKRLDKAGNLHLLPMDNCYAFIAFRSWLPELDVAEPDSNWS